MTGADQNGLRLSYWRHDLLPSGLRLLYSLLLYLAMPFIVLRLLWHSRKVPAYRQRWNERFGYYRESAQGVIWLHAVSVGETEAALPLIKAIRRQHPDRSLLVTTTTPTGSARVRESLGDGVHHVYLPYDLRGCAERFLTAFRPLLGIILETEIWPNLYYQCGQCAVPLIIVNARLSEKSARRYRKVKSLTASTLQQAALILAQTSADCERFISVGAEARRIKLTGNIKFDLRLPEDLSEQAKLIRRQIFLERPVWIAGSTHEGEEEAVLDVFAALRKHDSRLLLVLAPRHPERFGDVAWLCRRRGLSIVLRREEKCCNEATAVFLLDTLGELRLFYAASDIAFVGGSLVPRGGHNVLEPASAGVPTLFGPHMFNFADISLRLLASDAAIQVTDHDDLADAVSKLLSNKALREGYGDKARRFVAQNRGALDRVLTLLEPYLQSSST